jgi:hypothetical protein
MPSGEADAAWSQPGATLSDKSARKDFGLTQAEILQAIQAGKLQYRQNSVFGNPFLRLLRREVEALVEDKYGNKYLKQQQLKTELGQINKELRRLKAQLISLEHRKAALLARLEA